MPTVTVNVGTLTNCRIRRDDGEIVESGTILSFEASAGAEGFEVFYVESGYAVARRSGRYADPTVDVYATDLGTFKEVHFEQFCDKLTVEWTKVTIPHDSTQHGKNVKTMTVNADATDEGYCKLVLAANYDSDDTVVHSRLTGDVISSPFSDEHAVWFHNDHGYSGKIVPDDGWKINHVTEKFSDLDGSVTQNLDGTWSVVCEASTLGWMGGLSLRLTESKATTRDYYITLGLEHCTINISQLSISHEGNVVLDSGTCPVLKPDPGYVFEDPPAANWNYYEIDYKGVLKDDGTVEFQSVPLESIIGDIRITATAVLASEPVEEMNLGFVNVYHPSKDELVALADCGWPSLHLDLNVSEWIVSVYKTFIRPLDATSKVQAMFGTFNTNVLVYKVIDQYAIADCGTVTLEEQFENVLDYEPTTVIQLWLPFIGLKSIPTADVMGKELRLVYKMNVLNGQIYVELSRVSDSVVVEAWTGTCKENIQFMVNSRLEQTGGEDTLPAFGMGGRTPYFVRKVFRPIGNSDFTNVVKKTKAWVALADMSGWCQFSHVVVDGIAATSAERNEIERLLLEGVIL